jgi:HEAT repeat protein
MHLFKKPNVDEMEAARDISSLIKALKSRDYCVRRAATAALCNIGDVRAAVEPLRKALNDKDRYVRANAAEALGLMGDTRAIELLTQAVKDEAQSIRGAAAATLEKIGKTNADPQIEALVAKGLREYKEKLQIEENKFTGSYCSNCNYQLRRKERPPPQYGGFIHCPNCGVYLDNSKIVFKK